MQNNSTKTGYHPCLLVTLYLNCLPENILQFIPRSTKYDWDKRETKNSFGYDWFLKNKDLFYTLHFKQISYFFFPEFNHHCIPENPTLNGFIIDHWPSDLYTDL